MQYLSITDTAKDLHYYSFELAELQNSIWYLAIFKERKCVSGACLMMLVKKVFESATLCFYSMQ